MVNFIPQRLSAHDSLPCNSETDDSWDISGKNPSEKPLNPELALHGFVLLRAGFQFPIIPMTRVVINGSKGRMGQSLLACADRIPHLEIVAAVDVGDDLTSAVKKADVVIDFTLHTVTASVAELCALNRKALVIGTTGQVLTTTA